METIDREGAVDAPPSPPEEGEAQEKKKGHPVVLLPEHLTFYAQAQLKFRMAAIPYDQVVGMVAGVFLQNANGDVQRASYTLDLALNFARLAEGPMTQAQKERGLDGLNELLGPMGDQLEAAKKKIDDHFDRDGDRAK